MALGTSMDWIRFEILAHFDPVLGFASDMIKLRELQI
jgi:hypothetical protein